MVCINYTYKGTQVHDQLREQQLLLRRIRNIFDGSGQFRVQPAQCHRSVVKFVDFLKVYELKGGLKYKLKFSI